MNELFEIQITADGEVRFKWRASCEWDHNLDPHDCPVDRWYTIDELRDFPNTCAQLEEIANFVLANYQIEE